jgi:uncharacterized protein YkwD
MLLLLALLAQAGLPSQAQLESAFRESAAAACPRMKVAFDQDLTRACKSYVSAVAAGRAELSGNDVLFFSGLESYEPSPLPSVAAVTPPSTADRGAAQLIPQACHFNRAGIAAAVDPAGRAVVCSLVAQHSTDLSPIPGRVRAGDSVTVSGVLGEGLRKPRIFVTRPSGEVEQIPLENPERLLAVVPVREKGEHSIEVLADSDAGPQVVALRRVFAGVAPPDRPPKAASAKGGTGLSRVEAAINQLRAAHGLARLQRDGQLDDIALGHSREMARLKTFAHVLPTDGSLDDRLKAKGWAFRGAGENIGFADDAVAAHEAIASSPAHLANLLNPQHRKLGLAAVHGTTADGLEGVYLTEVLASPVVAPKDPASAVARELERVRETNGLPPLERDKMLDYLATMEARSAVQRDEAHLRPELTPSVMKEEPNLESAVAEIFVASSPAEIVRSKNSAEPRWTRLGVGAVYASSKRFGPGRLWVVLIYAR